MKLLWLLAIPVWIFVACAGLAQLINRLQDDPRWWSLPLWMAIFVPVFLGSSAGVLFLIFLAVGAPPK